MGLRLLRLGRLKENLIAYSTTTPDGRPLRSSTLYIRDELEIVRVLEDTGIFLIRGAVDYVADALGVSRPTVYNYLAELRSSERFGKSSLSQLHAVGLSILLVEQNCRMSLKVADYGYVLETGNIVLEGTAKELISNPRVQQAYVGKQVTLPA